MKGFMMAECTESSFCENHFLYCYAKGLSFSSEIHFRLLKNAGISSVRVIFPCFLHLQYIKTLLQQ